MAKRITVVKQKRPKRPKRPKKSKKAKRPKRAKKSKKGKGKGATSPIGGSTRNPQRRMAQRISNGSNQVRTTH
jgi:hypothetical protein